MSLSPYLDKKAARLQHELQSLEHTQQLSEQGKTHLPVARAKLEEITAGYRGIIQAKKQRVLKAAQQEALKLGASKFKGGKPPKTWKDTLRDGDEATAALISAANATGQVLFTRTVLDGRVVLRFSIGARTTRLADVRDGWALLLRLAS